jgi:hypothetical protein
VHDAVGSTHIASDQVEAFVEFVEADAPVRRTRFDALPSPAAVLWVLTPRPLGSREAGIPLSVTEAVPHTEGRPTPDARLETRDARGRNEEES